MNLTKQQALELYNEALDEEGEISIGSLTYLRSQVLKAVDPIAYKIGFDEYCDASEIELED